MVITQCKTCADAEEVIKRCTQCNWSLRSVHRTGKGANMTIVGDTIFFTFKGNVYSTQISRDDYANAEFLFSMDEQNGTGFDGGYAGTSLISSVNLLQDKIYAEYVRYAEILCATVLNDTVYAIGDLVPNEYPDHPDDDEECAEDDYDEYLGYDLSDPYERMEWEELNRFVGYAGLVLFNIPLYSLFNRNADLTDYMKKLYMPEGSNDND